jgi:predicted nuclease with TOPRIM domain
MQDKLHQRLQALKGEYEAGQKMLVDLETKQTTLRDTLLRISGAIQVLEELIAHEENYENNASVSPHSITEAVDATIHESAF